MKPVVCHVTEVTEQVSHRTFDEGGEIKGGETRWNVKFDIWPDDDSIQLEPFSAKEGATKLGYAYLILDRPMVCGVVFRASLPVVVLR